MKTTISLLSLTALGGLCAYGATPVWNITDAGGGNVTYTTAASGTFTFDGLGPAAISGGESFTLTVEFTSKVSPWVQNGAITPIAAMGSASGDIYDLSKPGNDSFRVYYRPEDSFIELQINKWQYNPSPSSADKDKLTNISFSGVPETISEETPITFGFTLQYVNGTDAQDGDDYWVFSPSAGSQITFDPHKDANVRKTLNFSDFTNATSYNAAPEGLLTTISITKAGIIPEPSAFAAAVGLGVLGLAAVRRRRR